jgi:hypothetical protein
MPRAGLSALAEYSMLAPPPHAVVAVARDVWATKTRHGEFERLPPEAQEGSEVEVWSYDPQLFAAGGVVDRFSLYLSLKDDEDERTQTALDEMMERIEW